MAPGVGGLPAAEAEVEVSAPVARFLAGLPPRNLKRLRLALRGFELLPFPWRFSRLDLGAREDFLARMEGSRFGPHRDLLLMAKVLSTLGYAVAPQVRERVGYSIRCALAEGGSPAPAAPLGDTSAPAGGEECDVVIVGSGAGGAAAAAALAEAGLDVIVLEAGGHYDRDTYPSDPLEAIASLYREGGLTVAEGRPPVPIPVGRAVGGTTVINSGTCFRAPEPVLERWRNEFGIEWARSLDPEYAEAEEFLRVTPLDPERMGRNGQLAMEGAAALGASGGPISRNAGSCVQCGSCPFGCAIDAKRGMHVSYLPRAVAAGARLRANVEVTGSASRTGGPTASSCLAGAAGEGNGSRRPYAVRARAVVVGGGRPGDARAAAALRARRAAAGPQPPHPPGLLGRRRLPGGGARLGGRHAELLHRSVGDRSRSSWRRPSRRFPSGVPGCPGPGASTSARCSASPGSARSASISPTAPGAGSAWPATGR